MAKQEINILLRSKILVGIVIPALFLLGVLQLVQGLFIDAEYYRAQAVQFIKEKTGKDVVIRGEVTVSLLPVPTLYIPGVELKDTTSDTPFPGLTIEMVYVEPSFSSLFSGAPVVRHITFEHPILEVRRGSDRIIHWDWLSPDILQSMAHQPGGEPVDVSIVGGGVVYRSEQSEGPLLFLDINAKGTVGSRPELAGAFSLYGHELHFDARASAAGGDQMPVTIDIAAGENNKLTLDGTVSVAAEIPEIKGKIALTVENILEWTREKKEEKQALLDQITNKPVKKEELQAVLPLNVSGQWTSSDSGVHLAVDSFQGLNSAGTGSIDVAWVKNMPRIVTDIDFSVLDYNQWETLFYELSGKAGENKAVNAYQTIRDAQNPLPGDIAFVLNIIAKQVYFNGQTWEKSRLSLDLENAAITVNQFDIQLPGESFLSLFGVISHSSTRGLRFEGSMETGGKSLRELLAVLDSSAHDLPGQEFGDFRIRSNLYIAPDQIRLSEADTRIGELHLKGGLVAYYDEMPRLEAEIRLQDINFDYFRDTWRERNKENEKQEFFLEYDKSQSFSWLKKLKASIDFKVLVDRFTFFDRQGDSAAFRIFAREGEFGVYNITLNYPTDTLQASFSLDVKGEQPVVNVQLNTDTLDLGYFALDPEKSTAAAPLAKKQWSEDLIDMSWMEGIGGNFDISINNVAYDTQKLNNLKLRAKLENNLVTLSSLSFGYWDGRCSVNGSFYGGKVPGVSIGFTLYNAELKDILESTTGRDNITGRVSISGTLTTSGVNYLSWVSQASSEMVFTGRGVVVDGFNLQGVVDAVTVSRTAADVLNNVNISLVRGNTGMSVDGNINVKNGLMRTPGITVRAGAVTGNLSGDVKLVPWTMELSSLYQFPAMTSETIPTLTVQLIGPIDAPEMHVDTASLEAYVAKRMVGSSIGR